MSCERFGFCQAQDATSFRTPSPIHTLSATIVKNPLLPTDDPVGGFRWQFEVREGYTSIARTRSIFFTRLLAEAAFYQALSPQFVLALRALIVLDSCPERIGLRRWFGTGRTRWVGEEPCEPLKDSIP